MVTSGTSRKSRPVALKEPDAPLRPERGRLRKTPSVCHGVDGDEAGRLRVVDVPEAFDHFGLQRAIAVRMQHLGKNELAWFGSAGVAPVDAAVGALATIVESSLPPSGVGSKIPNTRRGGPAMRRTTRPE